MSEKKIRITQLVKYKGHSVSQNGVITFSVIAKYDELPKTIMTLQMLNNDITLAAKIPQQDNKPFKLGMFRLKNVTVDGDGESVIKFNGLAEYIEMDALNVLPLNQNDEKTFALRMSADVELEE